MSEAKVEKTTSAEGGAGKVKTENSTSVEGIVAASAVLSGLALSGAATLKVLDGEGAVRRGLWTLITLLHLDRELEVLRHRRDDLRGRLLLAVKTHITPGVQRLVPEDEHDDPTWLDDDDHDVVA